MDNITHSLTGALAAKIIETNRHAAQPEQKSMYRTVFWLTVICANLPDIDALFNWAGDPFFVIKHHRSITHSLLFAPVLAFLPALVAYLVTSVKNLKLLWLTALIGVYLHIFFDLITAFGTQLFAPLSAERYSLDWMFIIDPLFTITLIILMFLGKRIKRHSRAFTLAGGVFVVSYLLVEMASHGIAVNRVTQTAKERGIEAERISALAQPLSIFRWMGLVQASDGVYQAHFSIFDNPEPPAFTKSTQASDEFVERALETEEAKWFMKFARHPLIQSRETDKGHIVGMRDMQFSFDPKMTEAIGNALGVAESERRQPFILVFEFSGEGELLATKFNR
ncbi:MAG: metal-dependent hydrolase [Ignavibacteriae bacterium]|nr:metal-dependent hydrolase [Ignavibacteriota bacterium]